MVPCCKPSIFKVLRKSRHYPQELTTLGDHIRARRLDLGLEQKDVAILLKVCKDTIKNWENNHFKIEARNYPAIMDFLGYCLYEKLITWGEKLRQHRIHNGMSTYDLARLLEVDPKSIQNWERGTAPTWEDNREKAEGFMKESSASNLSSQ
mgnify:CR=1 FL=1